MHTTPAGRPLRVLHALAVSLPHLNGYTVRSHSMLKCAAETEWAKPVAITSPFYPGNPASITQEVCDGISYHRVPHPSDLSCRQRPLDLLCRLFYRLRKAPAIHRIRQRLIRLRGAKGAYGPGGEVGESLGPLWRRRAKALVRRFVRMRAISLMIDHSERWLERLEEFLLVRRFVRSICDVAQRTGAEILHGHSPYRTGLPAIRAARKLGLPVVYEVRGLWEESAVASGWFSHGDERYRHWRNRETEAMRGADAVITISEALREEVVSRGVPREAVFVVPNAVDPERFKPLSEVGSGAPAETIRQIDNLRQRLQGTVFGYVGSVRSMEGVDELIHGAAVLARLGNEVSVLIVGDGPHLGELALLAEDLGIADRVVLPGRVPHDEVSWYYSLIDVFVVSRPDFPVTRTVTPLKPLEAMAMGKPVIVSDLPALREIVRAGDTGLLYRVGEPNDLARQALRLIENPDLLERMGRQARHWVNQHRTWEHVLKIVPEVYRLILDRDETT